MPRSRTRRKKGRGHPGRRLVWIGGRRIFSPASFDDGTSFRRLVVLWVDSEGRIVGHQNFSPTKAEGSLGQVLLAAMEDPLAGPRRRPTLIRVENEGLAAEVRQATGGAIPIRVAPTPEVDAAMDSLLEIFSGKKEEFSYLEGGRISPETVAGLFASSARLFRCAPWNSVHDSQVLRMDIPALGVDGACISIMGFLGESYGAAMFQSLASFLAFVDAVTAGGLESGRPVNLGTSYYALNFTTTAELPDTMRREVRRHAWPVAGRDAYPLLLGFERDASGRSLEPRDLEIFTSCADALCSYFDKHRARMRADEMEPISEIYSDSPLGRDVRITYPYVKDLPALPSGK